MGCNPRELPGIRNLVIENEKQTTRQTEEAIKNSHELQELDKMCKQIPLPLDFKFVWKGGIDDEKISLSSYYYSETSLGETKNFYNQYFIQNNWHKENEDNSYPPSVEFRNSTYRVVIHNGGMGSRTNYSIYCEKLSAIK